MKPAPEKTGRKQAATRFKPGKSGNPSGRPQGARNKASMLAEKLLAEEVESVCQTVLDAAKGGDMTACRLVLERLVPPARERSIDGDAIKLPASIDAKNAGVVFGEILKAVTGGRICPGEGDVLVKMLRNYLEAFEYQQIADRLTELEETAPRNKRW